MAVAEWVQDLDAATRDTFTCSTCLDRGLDEARNCGNQWPQSRTAKFIVYGHRLTECPISAAEPWASEAVSLVNLCAGEMGGLVHLPITGGVLDQSAAFFSVYGVVMRERARIREVKRTASSPPASASAPHHAPRASR